MEAVKNAFLVITGSTTVSVATETVKERNEWLNNLRNAVAALATSPGSARSLQWSFEVSIKGFIARKPPGGGKEYTVRALCVSVVLRHYATWF